MRRNNNRPAIIEFYHKSGSIKHHEWKVVGIYYRKNNSPTSVDYYENGSIKS